MSLQQQYKENIFKPNKTLPIEGKIEFYKNHSILTFIKQRAFKELRNIFWPSSATMITN